MKNGFKKRLKKILFIFLILLAAFSVLLFLYIGKVYIEFLANRNSIFEKIEIFSQALKVQKETDITLGQEEKTYQKPSYILDRNGKVIAKYSPQKHKLVTLKEMPFFLSRGYILIEDKAFFRHHGINYKRLTIAIIRNIMTLGKSPGGSTISQQLAKILFTKHERSVKRKIYEYFCARELEKRFSKNEILIIYLNSNYLGHGNYGIANAANFYFGKSPSELTIGEAALLIGMNRSAERYSPIRNKENAERIVKVVLSQFNKAGFINDNDVQLEISRLWENFNKSDIKGIQSFWKTEINRSGYITEYIRRILDKELKYDKITKGGLRVETTIDLEKQLLAEKTVHNQINAIRQRIKDTADKMNLKNYDDALINKIEGSFVSLEPKKGEILTIVGGSGYSFANQLNRATQTYRPIGSSVKPLIYALALNEGEIDNLKIHPFSKFKDEIAVYVSHGKKYSPKNYYKNHTYGNMVTLYEAVKTSLNTVAAYIMDKLDFEQVAHFIKKAASLEEDNKRVPAVHSLSLGTCELSTLELARAYAMFPRGGSTVYPYIIKKISDDSHVYYDIKRENNQKFNWLYPASYREPIQLVEPEVAFEVVQMLNGVFEENGTGYWPAIMTGLKKRAYGKSGTSDDYKDGWFAGFTDSEVSVAWIGIDTNQSILLSGNTTAGMVWCDYNAKVASNIKDSIEIPHNMKLLSICTQTGLIANRNCPEVKKFYFKKNGPLPEPCYIHQENDAYILFDEE